MNVGRHVRKLLARGSNRSVTAERIFPGFFLFERGERPAWWTEETSRSEWGEVLGVNENAEGHRDGSLVVTESGIALLGISGDRWVPYGNISGWKQPSKVPPATSLRISTIDGNEVALPFERGDPFTFMRFLSSAISETAE